MVFCGLRLETAGSISRYTSRPLPRVGTPIDPGGFHAGGDGGNPQSLGKLYVNLERTTHGAGADPGMVEIETVGESLYDWADFAYRYEVWNMNLPEGATAAERSNKDAWLRYLDRLAVKHGKRRPDHLRLLRQRGALSMAELHQRRQAMIAPAQHVACPLVRPDQRRDAHHRHPPRFRQNRQRGAPR